MSPTKWAGPSYTTATGVTVYSGTKWTRIGHIVILFVQVSIPELSTGTTAVTFQNIPAPSIAETFAVLGNRTESRMFLLNNNKALVAGGNLTAVSWLSGTFVYTTNELI